ncbi:MAG TPA: oxygenase MpaB family protein [Gaiellaceae bacterium]|nr:oxygenase MpaB family protein [Gaiellaceae bacterium]
MGESPYLREIRGLDPVADHSRIVYLDTCLEFPWDTTRSLELALFRTFAVPSIAELLDRTGEFGRAAQKRYDDTDLILSTIVESGYESEEGRRAIRQMNRIHGRFEIANEDFLYVLSSFVFEPIRWNARFGWRPLIETEKLATFEFWREIGRRMAIGSIPESYEELELFNAEYERERFRRTDATERVGRAAREMFLARFPGVPRRLGAQAIHTLMDEPLLDAFGFPRPPPALRSAVESSLRARGWLVAALPARRSPRHRTLRRTRTYGREWRLDELGPSAR